MSTNEYDINEEEYDMEHIAHELTRYCTEYVDLSNDVDEKKKEIKQLTIRQKELSTKITSLMTTSDLDEVNCGNTHKIVIQERKSTSALKMDNIANILSSSLNVQTDEIEKIMKEIKDTRMTTFRNTVKLKKRD